MGKSFELQQRQRENREKDLATKGRKSSFGEKRYIKTVSAIKRHTDKETNK